MPELGRLVLHALVVDDLDYTPLLTPSKHKEARVMATRGMTPAHDALVRQLPSHG